MERKEGEREGTGGRERERGQEEEREGRGGRNHFSDLQL